MFRIGREHRLAVGRQLVWAALSFAAPALAQQAPGLIAPNVERQGIPQIRPEEVSPHATAPRALSSGPALADLSLASPLARIDVQSALLAPQIAALLNPFIGKSRISGEELARARGEVWDLLRRHGRMTRVELSGESSAQGSVLHVTVRDIAVRAVLVEPERGSVLGQKTLDDILASAKTGLAEGGLLDIEGLENRIRRRLFLRDVDLRAVLVPVGVDQVNVKILVARRPAAPIGLLAQLDNFGPRSFGQNRYTLGLSLAGRIVDGDQLDLMTINSSHMHYGRIGYEFPLLPLGARVDVSGAIVTYQAASGAKGQTTVLGSGLSYPFHIGDRTQWIGQLHYQHRQQTDRLDPFGNIADKATDSVKGALDFRIYPGPAQVAYFTPALSVGRLDLSGLASALAQDQFTARTDGGFAKLEWEAGWNMLFGQRGRFDARIDAMGQFADRNLDQSEKFALGGPRGIRAYGSAEALGDEGALVNAELGYRPLPWLRAYTFYGVGRIRRNLNPWAVESIPQTYTLQGAGIGLSANVGPAVGSLIYTRQIGNNPGRSADGLDSDGLRGRERVWFTLTLRR